MLRSLLFSQFVQRTKNFVGVFLRLGVEVHVVGDQELPGADRDDAGARVALLARSRGAINAPREREKSAGGSTGRDRDHNDWSSERLNGQAEAQAMAI